MKYGNFVTLCIALLLVFLEFFPSCAVRLSIQNGEEHFDANIPKNGADLIFFGSNVHTGSKIEDAAKTANALAKAMENTKPKTDADEHGVEAAKSWHDFRMEKEDGSRSDVIQEDEEKQMKQNLDIESLYDTLEGNERSKVNKTLEPQDSKAEKSEDKTPTHYDRSTVKDAEEQSDALTTAWLKRHTDKSLSNFRHIHDSYTPGLDPEASGQRQAESVALLSEMKNVQDKCQNCKTGNFGDKCKWSSDCDQKLFCDYQTKVCTNFCPNTNLLRRLSAFEGVAEKHLGKCDGNFRLSEVNLYIEEVIALKTRSYIPDVLSQYFFNFVNTNKTLENAYNKIIEAMKHGNNKNGADVCDSEGLVSQLDIFHYRTSLALLSFRTSLLSNGLEGGNCESSYACKLPFVCGKSSGKCEGTTLSSTIDKAYAALIEIEYVALVAWLDNNDLVVNNVKFQDRSKKIQLAFSKFKRVWENTKKVYLSQSQSLVISTVPEKWDNVFQSNTFAILIRNVDLDIGHVERFLIRGGEAYFTAYQTHKKLRELRVNLLALLKQLLNEVKGGVGDKCLWDGSRQVKAPKSIKPSIKPSKLPSMEGISSDSFDKIDSKSKQKLVSDKSSNLSADKEAGKIERTNKKNNMPPQEILKEAAKIENTGHAMGAYPFGGILKYQSSGKKHQLDDAFIELSQAVVLDNNNVNTCGISINECKAPFVCSDGRCSSEGLLPLIRVAKDLVRDSSRLKNTCVNRQTSKMVVPVILKRLGKTKSKLLLMEEGRVFGHNVIVEFQDTLGYVAELLVSPTNPDFTCLDPHLESETTRLLAVTNALMLSLRMFQEPEGNACIEEDNCLPWHTCIDHKCYPGANVNMECENRVECAEMFECGRDTKERENIDVCPLKDCRVCEKRKSKALEQSANVAEPHVNIMNDEAGCRVDEDCHKGKKHFCNELKWECEIKRAARQDCRRKGWCKSDQCGDDDRCKLESSSACTQDAECTCGCGTDGKCNSCPSTADTLHPDAPKPDDRPRSKERKVADTKNPKKSKSDSLGDKPSGEEKEHADPNAPENTGLPSIPPSSKAAKKTNMPAPTEKENKQAPTEKENKQAPNEKGNKEKPKAPVDECGGCPEPMQCLPNKRTGCTDDSECSNGDICAGGICRGKGTCKGRADCKADEICISGICKEKTLCSADADCRPGSSCVGGRCEPLDVEIVEALCKTKNDCKPGEECISGTCEGSQTECNGDGECTRSEKCVDGFCRSNNVGSRKGKTNSAGVRNERGSQKTNKGIGDLIKTAANLALEAKNGPGTKNGVVGGANGNGQGGSEGGIGGRDGADSPDSGKDGGGGTGGPGSGKDGGGGNGSKKKKKCKKGLLGAIMCLVKKVVKAVGKGVKHVGKKLGDAFKFKERGNHGNRNVVVYEYEPVDGKEQLMFKEASSTFVYEKPKLPQNPQSNMMQRPHEKMVCRMPEQPDELSPGIGPQKAGAPKADAPVPTSTSPKAPKVSPPNEPRACPACAAMALDSPSPIPVCKDKKPPMDPKILVPDAEDKKKQCGSGKGILGVITCFIKKVAAASKKFVSKLGKVAFQEVGAEIKLRADCLDANDLHDLVCKKAGACGEKKNDCPKSKGDLGAVLGAIAGVAHKQFLAAEAKNREKAMPPSKFEDSNNRKSITEQISTLKTESGGDAVEAGAGGGGAGGGGAGGAGGGTEKKKEMWKREGHYCKSRMLHQKGGEACEKGPC